MNWKYYEAKFEFSEDIFSAWWGHVFFAYDLIRNIKPKKVVELGTHNGVSFFAFAQATKDSQQNTKLYAVDAWEGDKHAGFYNDDIYNGVVKGQRKNYANLDIKLYKMYFDEAIIKFENNSIDILHIDGLHTYKAVKHDFKSWLPKMKSDGIILFHDIHEKKGDFGVFKLWNELKEKYKSVEFYHWHGLGVLFMEDNVSQLLTIDQDKLKGHYANQADRFMFGMLKNKEKETQRKEQQLKQKEQQLKQKEQQLKQKEQQIKKMETSKFWKMREKYLKFQKFFKK